MSSTPLSQGATQIAKDQVQITAFNGLPFVHLI